MSAAYESVAETRPRVRRDVLFTDTGDGVLFHNSSGGFRITSPSAYRLASLLVPHLNGRRTVAQLCAKLPAPQRAMIGQLVSALLTRELARDIPADEADPAAVLGATVAKRFASQIGYIDHFVDRAPQRFADFRTTTAAVVGSGPIAHACATSLVRNGMARVAVVGHGDGEAAAEAAELDATGVPARVSGWDTAGNEPTWADLADADVVLVAGGDDAPRLTHRLLAAGVPAGKTLVPAWTFGGQAVVGPAAGAAHQGCWYCAMLRLTANDESGAAARVWHGVAVAAAGPSTPQPAGPLAAMIGNLLAFEVFRLTTGALPAETDGAVIIQDLESLDVVSEPLLPHPRCVYCRPDPPRLALDGAVLDAPPAIRVIDQDEQADAAVEELTARQPLVAPHVGVFARYDDEDWDQTPVKIGTVRFTDPTGTPRRVSAFDLHHVVGARMRALAHAAVAYAGRVGAGEGPVTGESLVNGAPVELPRAAVEPFGLANADRTVEPTRAGAGAGPDQGAAVRDGLASALAFAALQNAIAGAPVTEVSPDALGDDPELRFLAKSAANLGVTVDLLDLGGCTPGGAHTLLARCTGPAGGGKLWTLAADPSWREAAVRTLCDLLGLVQIRQQSDPAADDGSEPVLVDFDADTLVPSGTTPAPADAGGGWRRVLDALAAAGTDVVVAPVGGADLPAAGLHTVRVVLTDRPVR